MRGGIAEGLAPRFWRQMGFAYQLDGYEQVILFLSTSGLLSVKWI